jgi:hypothetical protein
MVLPRQMIDLPMGMGLDEKSGQPSVPAGKLTYASNVRLKKLGALQSRPGYETLARTVSYPLTGDGSSITVGFRVAALEDELVLDTGHHIYSYLPTTSDRWIHRDAISPANVTRRHYGERGRYIQEQPCEAIYAAGVICQAWRSTAPGDTDDSVTVRVIDAESGARHREYTFTGCSTTKFRLVTMGNYAYLFFHQGTNIVVSILDLSSPHGIWPTPVPIVTAAGKTAWEVCVCEGAGYMYLAYITAAEAGGLIRIYSDLTTLGPVALSYTPYGVVTVSADERGSIWVAYDIAGASPALVVDTFDEPFMGAITSISLDTDIDGYGALGNRARQLGSCVYGTKCVVSYTVDGYRPTVTRVWQVTADGAAEACSQTYHVRALSQPTVHDSRIYLVATIPTSSAVANNENAHTYHNTAQTREEDEDGTFGSPQWGGFLLHVEPAITVRPPWDSTPANCVARLSWGTTVHPFKQSWPVSFAPGRSDAERLVAAPQKSEDISTADVFTPFAEGFDVFTVGLVGATAAYAPSDMHLPVETNHELVLSGGHPMIYDSNKVFEYGFHWYPQLVLYSASGDTGSLVAGQTYDYAVCYEWADAKGVWHRSAPSMYRLVTDPAGSQTSVTFRVPTLTLTDKQDQFDETYPVRISLFRTRLQQDPTDPAIYHVISTFHLLNQAFNDPSAAYVEFTDDGVSYDSSDDKLREKRQLYTNGSVVENIAPPAARHVCYHVNRLWLISADDPETIWLSKLHSFNEMPGFFDGWVIRIAGADLTALASLDGKLVAFSRDAIYAIFGSGPSDTDQGNDLSEPQLVSSDIGCIDARSVVQTPVGIFFQGAAGIYLLDRTMTVKPVGLPVEDTLASYPAITGACLIEADQELRLTASNGTNSLVLVYQYLLDQWYTWTLPRSSTAPAPALASSCVSQRAGVARHTVLTDDGYVMREEGLVDPDGNRPTQAFATAWIHLAGVQGYQRVRRVSLLGQYMGRCSVSVSGYVDYKTAVAWTKSWTADEVDALTANGRVQMQIHLPTQKCEAMRLYVVVYPAAQAVGSPTPDLASTAVRWTGLSLEVGAKRGHHKNLSSSERK